GHLDDVRTGALVLPGAGPEADDDQSPDQVGMAQRQRLRNAAAERKAEDVDRARPSALTKVAAWSASASMVSGVSPLELAIPALLNRMTGRLAASPSVTAGSQWSRPPRKCCRNSSGVPASVPNRR